MNAYESHHGIIATTMNDFPGYRVTSVLGLVRGITVRSSTFSQGLTRIFQLSTYLGGRQETFVEMCEQARREAYDDMVEHARALGANAVLAVRYDATELGGGASSGMTEVLAYGTAVVVEPAQG